MRKLITLDDLVVRDQQRSVQAWILWKCQESIRTKKIAFGWDGKSVEGGAVMAFVNQGRWLARCKVCGNPCYVSWKTPIFYCVECGNGKSAAAWPVEFPDERKDIELALLRRDVVVIPNKFIRNEVEAAFNSKPVNARLPRSWRPGISAADLNAETDLVLQVKKEA